MNPNQRLIDSLRQAAEFFEARPELPETSGVRSGVKNDFFIHLRGSSFSDIADALQSLTASLGMTYRDEPIGSQGYRGFEIAPGFTLTLTFPRRVAEQTEIERLRARVAELEAMASAEAMGAANGN